MKYGTGLKLLIKYNQLFSVTTVTLSYQTGEDRNAGHLHQ